MSSEPETKPEEQGEPQPEQMPTLLEQMGGVVGMAYSAVPVIVFVLANAIWGLTPAIWSAVGSAVLITVIRLVRKETIMPAISGLMGVGIAAFIAYRTGEGRGFFLFGIWQSLVYGGVMLLSIVLRWPLIGVVWNLISGYGTKWRRDKRSVRDYDIATFALAVVFAGRFVVQKWLYEENLVGWLAVAKIGMGLPLFGLALIVIIWAVRRSDKRLHETQEAEQRSDAEIEAELRAKYGQEQAAQ